MVSAIPDHIRQDTVFGFLDRNATSDRLFNPMLVSNFEANTMYKTILDELRRSKSFTFSVAFVSSDAIASLKQSLIDFPGRGRIITSTYLGFNSPDSFRELANLRNIGVDIFVFDNEKQGFHPKGFIFEQEHSTTAIVGSSNLTSRALKANHEWNLRFSALPDGDIVEQLDAAIAEQLKVSAPLTEEWIRAYESQYISPERRRSVRAVGPDGTVVADAIRPNAMQAEALLEIARVRESGEDKALVISATGTGKTILAALDVKAVNPNRVLFVVHREQILDRAIEEFTKVLDLEPSDVGKFVGSRRELDRRFVFATVQSLGTMSKLEAIPADYFDYVLVDEVHRAGAQMHQNIINYFTPKFMLGITATPERTDDFNVYSLFDFNVPYEIRLQKALEEDMLAPFHYYGVTDFVLDGETISDASQLKELVAPERVTHLLRAIERYGHAGAVVKGLMFCKRKEEAVELSRLLNQREVHGRTLRTRVLTADDSISVRESVVDDLEAGRLDYIITVDVFNEGIDIRSVNQVIMLRETKSSIVFTQQLGRGLRKSEGKSHLIVIDFIGNYANNFLVPIALFGDNSLNKDSIRQKMIEAQESGTVAGLSSVNFDPIAKERIFASIASTSLDSLKNLKKSFGDLYSRLGRVPMLEDFARFDFGDPVVIATARGNYWNLMNKFKITERTPSELQNKALLFLSAELLNGKRPHELLILDRLTRHDNDITEEQCLELFRKMGAITSEKTMTSIRRIFSMEFYTTPQQIKYGRPILEWRDGRFELAEWFAAEIGESGQFRNHVHDLIATGLYLSRHRYRWDRPLIVGEKYSRKDVCRLLNWKNNEEGTLNGYKADAYTATCPIFVKYKKGSGVPASTAYGNQFVNERTLHWYTKNNRKLDSIDVVRIMSMDFALHLFTKKSDDENSIGYYYLGRVSPSNPEQTKMPNTNLNVVTMTLALDSPVEAALYDYFTQADLGSHSSLDRISK